ncbi:hypothetical protein GGI05_003739 [Coemansia sp. RSA 2603]|nr:hypothetical protein GGI05_003739 [Coemansia sp. RSA 2603]
MFRPGTSMRRRYFSPPTFDRADMSMSEYRYAGQLAHEYGCPHTACTCNWSSPSPEAASSTAAASSRREDSTSSEISELKLQLCERLDEQWLMLRQLMQWVQDANRQLCMLTQTMQQAPQARSYASSKHGHQPSVESADVSQMCDMISAYSFSRPPSQQPLRFNPQESVPAGDPMSEPHATIALRAPPQQSENRVSAAVYQGAKKKRSGLLSIRGFMNLAEQKMQDGDPNPVRSRNAGDMARADNHAGSRAETDPEPTSEPDNKVAAQVTVCKVPVAPPPPPVQTAPVPAPSQEKVEKREKAAPQPVAAPPAPPPPPPPPPPQPPVPPLPPQPAAIVPMHAKTNRAPTKERRVPGLHPPTTGAKAEHASPVAATKNQSKAGPSCPTCTACRAAAAADAECGAAQLPGPVTPPRMAEDPAAGARPAMSVMEMARMFDRQNG